MNQIRTPPRPATLIYTITADIVVVLLFALAGRNSHREGLSVGGVLETAWPFLAALGVGWLICRTWRQPLRVWPQGFCLWLITVAGGMTLRVLSGATAAVPFVIVATLVLALTLMGHRLLATRVTAGIQRP